MEAPINEQSKGMVEHGFIDQFRLTKKKGFGASEGRRFWKENLEESGK